MSDRNLFKILKSKKPVEAKEVKRLLEEAPYSLPVQKLSNNQKNSAQYALMRYDWSTAIEDDQNSYGDVVEISEIELKDKKAKQIKKSSSRKKKAAPKVLKEAAKPKGDKKAKAKKKKKKKHKKGGLSKKDSLRILSSELDDFTLWLNKINKDSKDEKLENIDENKPNMQSDTQLRADFKKSLKKQKANKDKDQIKEMIEESVSDKENIASLSLAELYEKQGYIEKAIDMYEKLRLKNPEKSSFFAAQILKLKDKI